MKRENEKHRFINKAWFVSFTIGLAIIISCCIASCFVKGFNPFYIVGAIILLACVNIPTHFIMDNRGIYVYHLFFFKMEYLWNDVSQAYKVYSSFMTKVLNLGNRIIFYGRGTGPKMFDFPQIEISYSRRAKELIEQHLQVEMEDHTWLGDIKNFKKKREQKKLKKQKQHHKKKRK